MCPESDSEAAVLLHNAYFASDLSQVLEGVSEEAESFSLARVN